MGSAGLEFLDSWLGYRMRQVDFPGLGVAILAGNEIIFSRAYGYSNPERGEPLTTDHIFGVASQSKMFTATAILQLAERGKLSIDDRVCKHLPWLKKHRDERFARITVRQLLSHSAGLLRDGPDSDFWEMERPFPTQAVFRKLILDASLALEPSASLKYSNLGFALLGQIVEAASGQCYADFVTENIINQIGLGSTAADFKKSLRKRLAMGYGVPFNQKRTPLAARSATKTFAGAVGILATAEDMCRFARAHFFGNDILISDTHKRLAQRPHTNVASGYDIGMEFGLGFEIQAIGERRVVGHGGHMAGQTTSTFFDPEDQLAVSVMTNAKGAPAGQIVRGVFEALDWFATQSPAPKKLARFNARLRSNTSTVEVVAGKKSLAAIDPDDWEPFTWLEELERLDDQTLSITTPGSVFNEGEFLRYKFIEDAVQSVRYAGFTLLPEPIYKQLAEKRTPAEQEILTFDDLEHTELRIGRVIKAETCPAPFVCRLICDFGPQLGTTIAYLPAWLPGITRQSLPSRNVLGAVYPVWNFGKHSCHIVIVGLSQAPNTTLPLSPGELLHLEPDPAYPRTLWRNAAIKINFDYTKRLRGTCLKIQALPDYPVEDMDPDFSTESLAAWKQGKTRKAMGLFQKFWEKKHFWFQTPYNHTRIIIIDDPPSHHVRWSIEFAKRVAIPMGETVYTLPRKNLAEFSLPDGDFIIWANQFVTINGYTNYRWTHETLYETSEGNDITKFLQLKKRLIQSACTHGRKL